MRLMIAIRAFFAVLMNKETAEQTARLLEDGAVVADPKQQLKPEQKSAAQPSKPVSTDPARNPAITLLATLQREARLVDLIQEDLSQYSDAQVGAAARPCLQQCAGVFTRLFELQPVVAAAEGEMVDVGSNASSIRYQWVGEGTAASGKLVHHGWLATKIELPKWTGDDSDVNVVAPAQVQAP